MSEFDYIYGIGSGPEGLVCSKHFTDSAVVNYIDRNGHWSICNYCHKSGKVVDLEEFAEFLIEAVSYFYRDPADFASYNGREGGFLTDTFDTCEILFDIFELDVDVLHLDEDLRSWFSDAVWADEKGYYGEGSQMFIYPWKALKQVVKEKVNFKVYDEVIDEYHGQDVTIRDFLYSLHVEIHKLDIITTITDKTKIFRGRTHDYGEQLQNASDFASPPKKYANQPNRMSPSGVSMFYGAFALETAALEIIEESGPEYISMGKFKPESDLILLDLTRIPPLPSRFDEKLRHQYFLLEFLQQFGKDFSEPIARDGKQYIEYMPTQFMTDYFRTFTISDRKLDGVIYSSTKHKNSQCLVLFFDYEQSLTKLYFDGVSISAKHVNTIKQENS